MSDLDKLLKFVDRFYQINDVPLETPDLQMRVSGDLSIMVFCETIYNDLNYNRYPQLTDIIRSLFSINNEDYKFNIFTSGLNEKYYSFTYRKAFNERKIITNKRSKLYGFELHFYTIYNKFCVDISWPN